LEAWLHIVIGIALLLTGVFFVSVSIPYRPTDSSFYKEIFLISFTLAFAVTAMYMGIKSLIQYQKLKTIKKE